MAESASSPEPSPDKPDPIPDSYAIYVTGSALHAWQYRHSISEPDGDWEFVETFDRVDNPQLSLKQATLTAPTDDGYWVYTTEYDCFLGCE